MLARSALTVAATLCLAGPPAMAAPVDDLLEALRLPELIAVMQEEGMAHGDTLAEDMLADGPTPAWGRTVARIYDADRMEKAVREGFESELESTDIDPLLAFFESENGRRITDLEIEARAEMLEPGVEEAARETFRARDEAEDDPRLDRVERFVEVNDLVDNNVEGALNASFMFYRGLAEGGLVEMSEDEIIADVWSQEGETRLDTREWVMGFLLMAYEPLPQEALDAYIELCDTPAGQDLNRALFAGFNGMYEDLSYAMGLAVSQHMQGTQL